MKNNKSKILSIFIVFLLLIPLNIFAQEKILDKSHKKKPAWVNGTEKDFIIVTGRGKTIDEAKDNVLTEIRNEIVNSVAIYVNSASEISIENVNKNNVINTIEKFKNTSSVQTADIPSLKGITLNKVSDYYWEKFQDKKTKEITVAYHVKYPFSEMEHKKLVAEFNKKDQEMTSKLNLILENIEKTNQIEELSANIKELQYLSDYFVDQRKKQADLGIIKIKDMLKSIEIVPLENNLGVLTYTLKIGDKFYASSQKPKYKNSECVTIISKTSEEHIQTIKYSYEDCMEDEKNYIEIKYKFANTNVEQKFYFDITSDMVQIFLKGDINMKASDKDEENVNGFTCDFTVVSKYDAPFIIEKVVLNWPGLSPITVSNINEEYEGKGAHSFILDLVDKIDLKKTSSKNKPNIEGTIFYKSKTKGETKRHNFYNQSVNTDW
ncbi:MAG: hypothetical protein JXR51_03785 [Bacteroidales bacterium]|nr:hypothetical protein [Bacteroidales bacterium]